MISKPKKVVLKSKEEFNENYIYVFYNDSNVVQIVKNNNKFCYNHFYTINPILSSFDSFQDLIERCSFDVYILNNNDELGQFITGKRNFPIINKDTKIKPDEVSIDDIDIHDYDSIYVLNHKQFGLYKLDAIGDHTFRFTSLTETRYVGTLSVYDNLKDTIQQALDFGGVYRFENYESFLVWQIENSNLKQKELSPEELANKIYEFVKKIGKIDDWGDLEISKTDLINILNQIKVDIENV